MHSQSHVFFHRLVTGVLLALTFAIPTAAHADREVFRSVDSDGNVVFSDTPQNEDANRIVVRTSPTRPLSESAARASVAPQNGAEEEQDDEESATVQQEAAEMEQLRAQNCERATSNLNKLQTARRVYDPLPNGERRYLNDDELEQRKVQARADIQRWCSG